MRSSGCVCLSLLLACGGSGSDRSGLGSGDDPDAGADPADAGIPEDAGTSSDAGLDAGMTPDAATGGLVIDRVVVDGSFTQLHAGEFEILVTGSGLESVTDVTFDDAFILSPETLVVTATEVRAGMWLYQGATVGPRSVTLVSPDGRVTAPDALEVTPFIVEADAAADGRGTYESPMQFCDVDLDDAGRGDLVLVGAGEHVCGEQREMSGGVEVRGAGVDATILRVPGFVIWDGGTSAETSIHDLSVNWPEPGSMLQLSTGGANAVRDVRLEGAGIDLGPYGGSVIERVDISGCTTGIAIPDGQLIASDVSIVGCDTGLHVGFAPTVQSTSLNVTISDAEFLDNRLGIIQTDGFLNVARTVLRDIEATSAPAEVGLQMWNGYLDLTSVEITGYDQIGISATTNGGDFDAFASLHMEGLLIEGGQYGVYTVGFGDGVSIGIVDGTIRDQSVAAFSFLGYENTRFGFSNVALSVVSGFALEDLRDAPSAPGEVNYASGTTLNGRSFDGQLIMGPVAMPPDLFILDWRSGVQF